MRRLIVAGSLRPARLRLRRQPPVLHAWLSTVAQPPDKQREPKPSAPSEVDGLRRLLELYAPEKKPLAISMSALAASTAVYMALPAGVGELIDMVTRPEGMAELPTLAGVMTGVFVAGLAANVIHDYINILIGERIAARLRQSTYASIIRQELAFFDSSKTGELVNRLSADTTLVGKVLSDSMSEGASSLAMALGSAAMLFAISPQLGTVMVVVVPPIGVAAMAYGDYVERLTERVQTRLSSATVLAEEKLANIRAVRWFVREPQEVERYREQTDSVLQLARKRSLADALFFGGVDFSIKLGTLGVLVVGGQLVLDGSMTTGELTSFLMYTLYAGSCTAGSLEHKLFRFVFEG
ncbi:hypothetical protein ATCC90586_009597 [Pythium insidiosum]|nr:hypothetical protein ATCC90586_009597 [Pythium insidiosum]